MPDAPRPRRLLRRLAYGGVVLAVLVGGAYALRGPLFGGLLTRRIATELSAATGATFTVGGVSGGWLSDLTLEDVRGTDWPAGSTLTSVSAASVATRFRLRDLLDDPLAGLDAIDLAGAEVVVDLTVPATEDGANDDAGSPDDVRTLLRALPPITATGALRVVAAHGVLDTPFTAALSRARGAGADALPRLTLDAPGLDLHDVTLWARDKSGPVALEGHARLGNGRVEGARLGAGGMLVALIDIDLGRLGAPLRAFVGDVAVDLPRGRLSCGIETGDGSGGEAAFADIHFETDGWDGLGPPIHAFDVRRLLVGRDGQITAEGVHVAVTDGDAGADRVTFRTDDVAGTLSFAALRLTSRSPERHVRELGLALPDIAIDTLGPLVFDARASGADGNVQIESAVLGWGDDSPRPSRVELGGTLTLPQGETSLALDVDVTGTLDAATAQRLAPADWLLPAFDGAVTLEAHVALAEGVASATGRVSSRALRVDDREARDVAIDASYDSNVVRIADVHATTDFGNLVAAGVVDLETGAVTDGSFRVDVPDLATVRGLFPRLPDVAGTFKAMGTLSGNLQAAADAADDPLAKWPADLRVDAAIAAEGLVIDGAAIGRVEGAARMEGPRLEVERLDADGALARVRLSGHADLVSGEVVVPGFALAIPDLAALAPWLPALADVSGGGEIDGTLARAAGAAWSATTGAVAWRAARLGIGGNELVDVAGRVKASAEGIEVEELLAGTPWGRVSTAGILQLDESTGRAHLTRLDVDLVPALVGREGAAVPIRLAGPCDASWSADGITLERIDARAFGGSIQGTGVWTGEVALDLVGRGLDAAALLPEAQGALDVELTVRGDPRVPDALVRVSSPRLVWRDHTGRVDVALRQDADGLEVIRLFVDAGDLLRATGSGHAPLRLGADGLLDVPGRPAKLDLEATCAAPQLWFDRFGLDAARAGSAAARITARGRDLDAEITVTDAAWTVDADAPGPHIKGETRIHVSSGDAGLRAEVTGGSGTLRVAGEVFARAPADWRHPARAADALRDAPLTGTVRIDTPDLRLLADWVPGLHHVSGKASVDVAVAGTWTHPTWRGVLEATGLAVRLEGDLPAIDRGRARLVLDGRKVTVESLTGRLGFSPFVATGDVLLPQDGPPVMNLHVNGENLLLSRSRDVRLRADLDVELIGPLDRLLVRGSARIVDALITSPMDLTGSGRGSVADQAFQLFSLRDEPWASMRFDVRVSADHTVHVANNVLRGDFVLDLVLRGTGAVPEPEGRVDFRDTLVQLPLTRMKVASGSLIFSAGAPFDPQVRATAFTRLKGYDLDVQVTGGASDLRIHVASTPPLAQEDALLLLATGAAPADIARDGVTRIAVASAGTLLGEAVLAWFSGPGDPDEESILDRVVVDVGRDRSESGTATIEAEVEIRPRWFLRLERDRWDAYNAGVLWRLRFR